MDAFLDSVLPSEARASLRTQVLPALLAATARIGETLRASQTVALAGGANSFGDDQLNVDVAAEAHVRDAVARCAAIVTASSEEDPVERGSAGAPAASAGGGAPAPEGAVPASAGGAPASSVGGGGGAPAAAERYTIAFDPLDGSSIIAPNWSVGTIIGIWDGDSAVDQSPAERQIAAVLGVYGPRTTAIVALRIPGTPPRCFEVGLNGAAALELVRPEVRFAAPPFKTRYFAPANLRAAADDERYMALVSTYIQSKYTLRYSGGLVPDVVHALVKGHGVYLSPVTAASAPKLRKLYELFPVALVVECAGGRAVDPVDGASVLDRPAASCHEKAGLVCGTADEVERAMRTLLG